MISPSLLPARGLVLLKIAEHLTQHRLRQISATIAFLLRTHLGFRMTVGVLIFAAPSWSGAQTLSATAPLPPAATVTVPAPVPTAGDQAWSRLITTIQSPSAPKSLTSGVSVASSQAATAADQAKDFYSRFPQHLKFAEARKLEAVFLINAVMSGNTALSARMESTVAAVRSDTSLPAFERAVVAGTYEFSKASRQIKKSTPAGGLYETVARGLIHEFPDQPQGYISLLTQAMQRDTPTALAMANEVINAVSVPDEAKTQAQVMVNRFNLPGQSITQIFGTTLSGGTKNVWQAGRPGLIYIWATWSPNSLALGQMLAGKNLTNINVAGVCVDPDTNAASAAAAANSLPGRLIYVPNGAQGTLAKQLGAGAAPLVYFVDSSGIITDVRGLDNLDAKLNALGL